MRKAARGRIVFVAAFCSLLSLLAGCHSYHIDATIENRSGDAVRLLEVDYPSASFGADALAADADFHYRFDVRGSGPVTIQYTSGGGQTVKKTGPALRERQQGHMEIVLMPGGQVEFHTELTPQP